MRSVREVPVLQNIPILVRAALNEPVENGVVKDIFRLKRAVSTLQFLQSKGARIIVISHIGEAGTETLAPLASMLGTLVKNVAFFPETIGPRVREAIHQMAPGDILVLENLRRNRGEVGNDPAFAKELAMLADVFVEDSFDTCHREHASIVGVPKLLPSYAGLVLEEEVAALTEALHPSTPSFAIIGGAKFTTKKPVLTALLAHYDKVFVGGALASDFLKAAGHPVGRSLVSDAAEDQMRTLLANPKLVLPLDSRVAPANDMRRDASRIASLDDVKDTETILDHGPATEALLASLTQKAASILWNGPVGNYENGFVDTTDALALAIAKSSAHSIIGGGDTLTAIEKLDILSHFSFVSTGGGAMLEFLAAGSLPGITVLG